MASVLYQLRSELSRTLLENGVAGVGGLEAGEAGLNEDLNYLDMSVRKRASSGFLHFPSAERLAFYLSAANSGAKGIGLAPPSGMASTNVQDGFDELRAQVAAGGGGTMLGTMTTGKFPKAIGPNTVGDSILSEASSKLLFSGDSVANLYRFAAGQLLTDGHFSATTGITSGTDILALGDIAAAGQVSAGDFLQAGNGILSEGWMASPIFTTAAATLTLGAHHAVRTTHASPAITLPDSTTVAVGTEFFVFTKQNGCSFIPSGTDVWRGLNRDLGLGIEDSNVTTSYTAPRNGFMLKTDGAGHWYIWELG